MTLVGFHHHCPDSETTEIIIGAFDEVEYNRTCRWATDHERMEGSCFNRHETMAPSMTGEEDRKCCFYEPMASITESSCE